MSHLYTHFALQCARALNPRVAKNMEKAVRYAHRRVDRAVFARQVHPQAEANPKARGLLLLPTVLAASWDESGEPLPPIPEPENVTTIKKFSELETMLSSAGDKLVVIFCMVRWCPFCRNITPTVEEIAANGSQDLIVLKLDMDDEDTESTRIVSRYQAYYMQHGRFAVGLPTFVFIKEGTKLEHFTGADDRKLRGAVARKDDMPNWYKMVLMAVYPPEPYELAERCARKNPTNRKMRDSKLATLLVDFFLVQCLPRRAFDTLPDS